MTGFPTRFYAITFVRALAALSAVVVVLQSCIAPKTDEILAFVPTNVTLPDGFILEPATLPGGVRYPMFATYDLEGRLFVIESSGKTTSTEDVLQNPTFQILLLQDKDRDGVFDSRSVYADKIPYPMGGTFYRGSFYATAPPDLIRFTDTDGDDVADKREVVLTGWTLNHNAATLSGPFFGPDGWMYMCDARRGFNITSKEGTRLTGKGARIWRCRPDGTGLEWISGGGFDNTIELIFTPSGETIGTMTYFTDPKDGFRDALMHWVEGGVYPKPYPVIEEDKLKLTGELMPVMTKFARVSPAGLMRYRSQTFGGEYQGNLFSAQFNTGRIMRHVLSRDGATFRTVDEPFLTMDNLELHPTDVLEDADGSLLVVNTGGWFIAGCPLSVVAKTDVPGGIFRVRKKGAPLVNDPWGQEIRFGELDPEGLAAFLGDSRPVVRDRAVEALVSAGKRSIEVLTHLLTSSSKEEERTAVVFALHRIDADSTTVPILAALEDESPMVRTAAARCLGLAKARSAVNGLSEKLHDPDPGVRRQAATALGQIGDGAAVPALVAASAHGGDRFLEHAITHALITLGATEPLLAALKHSNENIRRTALVALDQIEGSLLRKANLVPFLHHKDALLRKTGTWVLMHHREWSDLAVGYVRERLASKDLTEDENRNVTEVLNAFSNESPVQEFVALQLSNTLSGTEERLLLLQVINGSHLRELPSSWEQILGRLLEENNPRIQSAALDVIQARRLPALDARLERIARDAAALPAFRIKALSALILSKEAISADQFSTVLQFIHPDQEPHIRQAAVRLIAQSRLTDDQLLTIANEYVPKADPYLLPGLVKSFEGHVDEEVGAALVRALPGPPDRLDNLPMETLQQALESYPASVKDAAQPLMKDLAARRASRLAALEDFQSRLGAGDVAEGRKLFFGKALCSTCHAVSNQGGEFGPDLTNIGEIRSQHDILEAIMYPGASFAREYETSRVVTKGNTYTGIIKEQLPELLVLETGPGVTVRVARNEITSVTPENLSLMPPGLEKQLSTEELSDLMAYLTTLPDGMGHLRQRP